MTLDWSYFYLFPLGIVIAILAMSSGISGTNFWVPVYVLWLKIEPKVGFWLALLTMLFGFGSGLVRNMRQDTVRWAVVMRYMAAALPAALLGTLLVPYSNPSLLLTLFGSFVILYAAKMLYSLHFGKKSAAKRLSPLTNYTVAFIGGFFKGLISTGLGKLILPRCIKDERCQHHSEAVGSVVVIVFATNIVAILFRLNEGFIEILGESWTLLSSILIFVVPGVIAGGQIGPMIAKRLRAKTLQTYVSFVLFLVGFLIILRAYQEDDYTRLPTASFSAPYIVSSTEV